MPVTKVVVPFWSWVMNCFSSGCVATEPGTEDRRHNCRCGALFPSPVGSSDSRKACPGRRNTRNRCSRQGRVRGSTLRMKVARGISAGFESMMEGVDRGDMPTWDWVETRIIAMDQHACKRDERTDGHQRCWNTLCLAVLRIEPHMCEMDVVKKER